MYGLVLFCSCFPTIAFLTLEIWLCPSTFLKMIFNHHQSDDFLINILSNRDTVTSDFFKKSHRNGEKNCFQQGSKYDPVLKKFLCYTLERQLKGSMTIAEWSFAFFSVKSVCSWPLPLFYYWDVGIFLINSLELFPLRYS